MFFHINNFLYINYYFECPIEIFIKIIRIVHLNATKMFSEKAAIGFGFTFCQTVIPTSSSLKKATLHKDIFTIKYFKNST